MWIPLRRHMCTWPRQLPTQMLEIRFPFPHLRRCCLFSGSRVTGGAFAFHMTQPMVGIQIVALPQEVVIDPFTFSWKQLAPAQRPSDRRIQRRQCYNFRGRFAPGGGCNGVEQDWETRWLFILHVWPPSYLACGECKAIEILPCVFLKAHSVVCGEAKSRPLHFHGTVLSESLRELSRPGLAIA